jgi:hypothetical protein
MRPTRSSPEIGACLFGPLRRLVWFIAVIALN